MRALPLWLPLLAVLLAGAPRADDATEEWLWATEGNRLRVWPLAEPERARVLVDNASGESSGEGVPGERRRDVNGTICHLPDGSGGFVLGEDTGQPETPPGWGLFDASGLQRGKLTATYDVSLGDPHGCAFLPDGRLITSEVGNKGFGTSRGQLILWFPPYDVYPGPEGAYPETDATSASFCKLATDIGTAGAVAVDAEGRIYAASSSRGTIWRFSPPFPTSPDAAGGCGGRDATGAPVADAVQREAFARGLYTYSGLAFRPDGHLYASSVFTGEIVEYDTEGERVRTVLAPEAWWPPYPTGTPQGIALDRSGNLYYADLDLVWDFPSVGPGDDGKVRRIRFDADGNPGAPEVLLDGLAFPDGVAVAGAPD